MENIKIKVGDLVGWSGTSSRERKSFATAMTAKSMGYGQHLRSISQ